MTFRRNNTTAIRLATGFPILSDLRFLFQKVSASTHRCALHDFQTSGPMTSKSKGVGVMTSWFRKLVQALNLVILTVYMYAHVGEYVSSRSCILI